MFREKNKFVHIRMAVDKRAYNDLHVLVKNRLKFRGGKPTSTL